VDINLNALSLKELKDLQTQVSRSIATFEDRKKREARAKVEEAARELGYSLSELAEGSPKAKSSSAAKYANPANRKQTWTGKGRQPGWFKAALAAGKAPGDLAV
jgi:DNA-binding protein H-NS